MFSKISFASFTYKFTETFFFPTKNAREIYEKHMTERVFLYSILADTDSICVFFLFICKPKGNLLDARFIDVLFEVMVENNILHRFDTSHGFLEKYPIRNKSLSKKVILA